MQERYLITDFVSCIHIFIKFPDAPYLVLNHDVKAEVMTNIADRADNPFSLTGFTCTG